MNQKTVFCEIGNVGCGKVAVRFADSGGSSSSYQIDSTRSEEVRSLQASAKEYPQRLQCLQKQNAGTDWMSFAMGSSSCIVDLIQHDRSRNMCRSMDGGMLGLVPRDLVRKTRVKGVRYSDALMIDVELTVIW